MTDLKIGELDEMLELIQGKPVIVDAELILLDNRLDFKNNCNSFASSINDVSDALFIKTKNDTYEINRTGIVHNVAIYYKDKWRIIFPLLLESQTKPGNLIAGDSGAPVFDKDKLIGKHFASDNRRKSFSVPARSVLMH